MFLTNDINKTIWYIVINEQEEQILEELYETLWNTGFLWIEDINQLNKKEREKLNEILESFSWLCIELQFNITKILSDYIDDIRKTTKKVIYKSSKDILEKLSQSLWIDNCRYMIDDIEVYPMEKDIAILNKIILIFSELSINLQFSVVDTFLDYTNNIKKTEEKLISENNDWMEERDLYLDFDFEDLDVLDLD